MLLKLITTAITLLGFFAASGQDKLPDQQIFEQFFADSRKPISQKVLDSLLANVHEGVNSEDRLLKADGLMALGLTHLTRTLNYEQAMNCFFESLTIYDSLDLLRPQVFAYTAIGHVYEEIGEQLKGEENFQRALDLLGQQEDKHLSIYLLLKIGRLEGSMGQLDEASDHYNSALSQEKDIGDPEARAEIFFQLGMLSAARRDYSDAMEQLKNALDIWRKLEDRNNEARALNDIGALYSRMSNHEKALSNHVVALKIRQELGDAKGIAQSYNNIAGLYFDQKNFDRSIANLELALDAAQDAQDQTQIRRSYELLSACYKELGDFKKSLSFKDLQLAMNEFIQNEKTAQGVAETQHRFEIGKQEARISNLESIRLQREKVITEQKRFRNFLMVLVASGIIIALLILYLYILKRRSNKILKVANDTVKAQNKQLQELNETKDKFFSIISHDLKGPLNSLTSFSSLLINHTDVLTKEEIRMLAKDLDKSLKNLFSLLENLLEWSRSQTGNIEFNPEPFDIALLITQNIRLLEAQAQTKQITLGTTVHGELWVHAHKHSVNTVIRNLMSNAIKFTPGGGTVRVDAGRKEKDAVISVADTGVGMSPEVIAKLFRIDTKHTTKGTADEKGTGLGLILCKDFVENNRGQIWVESTPGNGSIFHFTLPVREFNPVAV